jgi:hypothetical protein
VKSVLEIGGTAGFPHVSLPFGRVTYQVFIDNPTTSGISPNTGSPIQPNTAGKTKEIPFKNNKQQTTTKIHSLPVYQVKAWKTRKSIVPFILLTYAICVSTKFQHFFYKKEMLWNSAFMVKGRKVGG